MPADPTYVMSRLEAGDKLRMQFIDGRRIWWFENPRAEVSDAIAEELQQAGDLSELGDSLFGLTGHSQSWGGVDVPDRIPCINPCCRRTFKADDCGSEVVCGKCFRTLPLAVRSEHRRCWREYRKWNRRITRTGDVLKAQRMHYIRDRWGAMISGHWDREIRPFFLAPEKPEGLDSFLEEVGFQ